MNSDGTWLLGSVTRLLQSADIAMSREGSEIFRLRSGWASAAAVSESLGYQFLDGQQALRHAFHHLFDVFRDQVRFEV